MANCDKTALTEIGNLPLLIQRLENNLRAVRKAMNNSTSKNSGATAVTLQLLMRDAQDCWALYWDTRDAWLANINND